MCKNICTNRCRTAPDKAFRGYKPAHHCYFHGVKLHLLVVSGGFIAEFWLMLGSWHDLTGLYEMALDIPCGCALMLERGYTNYGAEDVLRAAEGLDGFLADCRSRYSTARCKTGSRAVRNASRVRSTGMSGCTPIPSMRRLPAVS